MKRDAAGKPLSDTRCTASGQERSWMRDAWVTSGNVICPDCGYVGELCWVRGTDLAPRAKTRAHNAPQGVTPRPYGYSAAGGPRWHGETGGGGRPA